MVCRLGASAPCPPGGQRACCGGTAPPGPGRGANFASITTPQSHLNHTTTLYICRKTIPVTATIHKVSEALYQEPRRLPLLQKHPSSSLTPAPAHTNLPLGGDGSPGQGLRLCQGSWRPSATPTQAAMLPSGPRPPHRRPAKATHLPETTQNIIIHVQGKVKVNRLENNTNQQCGRRQDVRGTHPPRPSNTSLRGVA